MPVSSGRLIDATIHSFISLPGFLCQAVLLKLAKLVAQKWSVCVCLLMQAWDDS